MGKKRYFGLANEHEKILAVDAVGDGKSLLPVAAIYGANAAGKSNLIEAKQKNYGLAISNPCFETWLCFHLQDLDPKDKTCQHFEQRLRSILGSYNKSNLDTAPDVKKIDDAIGRAKTLHPDPNQNWPLTPGSHVYRVVEMIQKIISD